MGGYKMSMLVKNAKVHESPRAVETKTIMQVHIFSKLFVEGGDVYRGGSEKGGTVRAPF